MVTCPISDKIQVSKCSYNGSAFRFWSKNINFSSSIPTVPFRFFAITAGGVCGLPRGAPLPFPMLFQRLCNGQSRYDNTLISGQSCLPLPRYGFHLFICFCCPSVIWFSGTAPLQPLPSVDKGPTVFHHRTGHGSAMLLAPAVLLYGWPLRRAGCPIGLLWHQPYVRMAGSGALPGPKPLPLWIHLCNSILILHSITKLFPKILYFSIKLKSNTKSGAKAPRRIPLSKCRH